MSRGIVIIKDLYRPNVFLYTQKINSLPIYRNVAPTPHVSSVCWKLSTYIRCSGRGFSLILPTWRSVALLSKHLLDTKYILENHVPRQNVFTVFGGPKFPTSMIHLCLASSFLKTHHHNLNVWKIAEIPRAAGHGFFPALQIAKL